MIEVEVLELVLLDEEVDEEDVVELVLGVVIVEVEVLEDEEVDAEDVVELVVGVIVVEVEGELDVLELVLVDVEIEI